MGTTSLSDDSTMPVPALKPFTGVHDSIACAPVATPTFNVFCLVDRSGHAMVTTLLSEVEVIPVPPLTPLTVVPHKVGSAPAAAPTVSGFCSPLRFWTCDGDKVAIFWCP